MTKSRIQTQSGFTLVEMAIVLGVMGVLISVIWNFAGAARQSQKVEQAVEEIKLTVDSVRGYYGAAQSMSGAYATIVPNLVNSGTMPQTFVRTSTTTSCPGNAVASYYVDNPFSISVSQPTYPCGTFLICPWKNGTNTACGVPSSPTYSQYFSIEITNLDYASCLALSERISTTTIPGLSDIMINGDTTHDLQGTYTSSVSSTNASTVCTVGSTTNYIDFVYLLRTPIT